MVQNPELLKQAFFLAKNFEKLERRKKHTTRPKDRRDIQRNQKIGAIVRRLRNLEEDLIARKNPLSLENVKSQMRHVLEGKEGAFTGALKVGFENDSIVEVELVPVETEEDFSEVIITSDKFQDIINALDNPDKATEEDLKLSEGIPKEKIAKAVEMNAEKIIKTPFLKLDGTIEYKITASLKH